MRYNSSKMCWEIRYAFAYLVLTWACIGLSISCGGNGDEKTSCTDGEEGCKCFTNGTCNQGLTCGSNLCVRISTGDSGTGSCTPNETRTCTCANNETGTQTCSQNGVFEQECQCAGSSGAGGTEPTSGGGEGGTSGTDVTAGNGGTGGTDVTAGTGGTIACSPAEQANACAGRVCGQDPICGVRCGTCTGKDVCMDGQCVTPCTTTQCGIDPVTQVDCGGCSSGSCCDGACIDTLTDRKNCGTCGHQCAAPYGETGYNVIKLGVSNCENGQCTPYFAACITSTDGFTTCSQYCASIDETCVAKGCGGNRDITRYEWESGLQDYCESLDNPIGWSTQDSCNENLFNAGSTRIIRCCCTDTH